MDSAKIQTLMYEISTFKGLYLSVRVIYIYIYIYISYMKYNFFEQESVNPYMTAIYAVDCKQ